MKKSFCSPTNVVVVIISNQECNQPCGASQGASPLDPHFHDSINSHFIFVYRYSCLFRSVLCISCSVYRSVYLFVFRSVYNYSFVLMIRSVNQSVFRSMICVPLSLLLYVSLCMQLFFLSLCVSLALYFALCTALSFALCFALCVYRSIFRSEYHSV